jgi:hydrogenase maturation protease
VVLGLGNLLLTDEGVGVHVVRRLAEMELPAEVEVVDGGTAPLAAVTTVEGIAKLIIIDALDAEVAPGAVYSLKPGDVEGGPCSLSLHEADLTEALALWRHWGLAMDRVQMIGIVPEVVDWGTELSPALREKLDEIVAVVLAEVSRAVAEGQDSATSS